MDSQENAREKVLEFLKERPHGILSTVSANGKPWGSSIYFAHDEDIDLFFITKVNTLKYKNIQENPNVALTISDDSLQTTVQIAGRVDRVPAKDIVDVVMKKLARIKPKDNNKWVPPIVKVDAGEYIVLKITPNKMHFANYQQVKSDIHDNFIERII